VCVCVCESSVDALEHSGSFSGTGSVGFHG
jgi:hypothetical protein